MYTLILLALAAYYTQRVLRWESGPFGIFDWIREKVFGIEVELNELTGKYEHQVTRPGTLADMVECVYCSSFWIASVLSASGAALGIWIWQLVPFYVLAVSGAAALIDRGFHGDS